MSATIDIKAAKARLERKKHAERVMDAFDKNERADKIETKEKRAEVERKARKQL